MDVYFHSLTHQEIIRLLKDMSPQFIPHLDESLNLEAYAEKLFNNAKFLIGSNNGEIKGTIVFYLNYSTSVLYIPLVWVDKEFRGIGLANQMFEALFEYGKEKGADNIDLEVLKCNLQAYRLYRSLGFREHEDRKEKFLMRYHVKNRDCRLIDSK